MFLRQIQRALQRLDALLLGLVGSDQAEPGGQIRCRSTKLRQLLLQAIQFGLACDEFGSQAHGLLFQTCLHAGVALRHVLGSLLCAGQGATQDGVLIQQGFHLSVVHAVGRTDLVLKHVDVSQDVLGEFVADAGVCEQSPLMASHIGAVSNLLPMCSQFCRRFQAGHCVQAELETFVQIFLNQFSQPCA